MSTQKQPAPVMAWHREAAKAVYKARHGLEPRPGTLGAAVLDEWTSIIASHDPHQSAQSALAEAKAEVDTLTKRTHERREVAQALLIERDRPRALVAELEADKAQLTQLLRNRLVEVQEQQQGGITT